MESTESNAQLAPARGSEAMTSIRRAVVIVPICVSRLDGNRMSSRRRRRRFAEALSFSDGWSRISDARNRRLAA